MCVGGWRGEAGLYVVLAAIHCNSSGMIATPGDLSELIGIYRRSIVVLLSLIAVNKMNNNSTSAFKAMLTMQQ